MMLNQLKKPAIVRKLVVALLLAGLGLLLIEVRFEHQTVLGKQWQAWIPLVYTFIMILVGTPALVFWRHGGRQVLSVGFAIAPFLGLFGFWFHSKGEPWLAICKVIRVICMMPGKIPMDVDGPPVLAPLAVAGLGALGLLICWMRCDET